jgi:hypothetical protein
MSVEEQGEIRACMDVDTDQAVIANIDASG